MNPNTFKLGYSQTWSDSWYSNNKLYPLMLNAMLNVRAIIINLFNKKKIEKMDIYLSHLQLGLNSGCLYISLFFYNTKFDYKTMFYSLSLYFKTFNSLPKEHKEFWKFTNIQKRNTNKKNYRERNYFDRFDTYIKDIFLRYPWFWPSLKWRNLSEEQLRRNSHGQNFFLFFYYLGFSPDVFIFNYYRKNFGIKSNWRWHRMVNKKRLVKTKKWLYINLRESYFLLLFYSTLLQKKANLGWLSNNKDDIHLMRFLRYLFFYGRMPFWGRRHRNLTVEWDDKKIKDLRNLKFLKEYREFYYKRNLKKDDNFIDVIEVFRKIEWKKRNSKLFRKKKIVKLLGDIYFNLFYANIYIKNYKKKKFGFLKNLDSIYISRLKKKGIKSKYEFLLDKVKRYVKLANPDSFLWKFKHSEKTYFITKYNFSNFKKTEFYNTFLNHAINMDWIREYWDNQGKLSKIDVDFIEYMDYEISAYFDSYYYYLQHYSKEQNSIVLRDRWLNFWKSYREAYWGFYKSLMHNVKLKNYKLDYLLKKKYLFDKKNKYAFLKEVGYNRRAFVSKENLDILNEKDKKYYKKWRSLLYHAISWNVLNNSKYINNLNWKKKIRKKTIAMDDAYLADFLANDTSANDIANDIAHFVAILAKGDEKNSIKDTEQKVFNYLAKANIRRKKKERFIYLQKKLKYGYNMRDYFINRSHYIKYDTLKKMRSDFFTMSVIRFSYARMFFMLWLLKLNTQFKKIKPYDIVNNAKFYKEWSIFDTLYLLYFILIKRPFLKMLTTSYLGHFIKIWTGFSSKFNFYILSNNEITSNYISNHIASAFTLGYNWKDVIRPIKRDLDYLLTELRFLDYGYKNKSFDAYKMVTENLSKNLFEHSSRFMDLYLRRYISAIYMFWIVKKIYNYFNKLLQNCIFRRKFGKTSWYRSFLFGSINPKGRRYFVELDGSVLYYFNLSTFSNYLIELKYYYIYISFIIYKYYLYNKFNLNIFIKEKKRNNYKIFIFKYYKVLRVIFNKILFYNFNNIIYDKNLYDNEDFIILIMYFFLRYISIFNIYKFFNIKMQWCNTVKVFEKEKTRVDWIFFKRKNFNERALVKVLNIYFNNYKFVNMIFFIKIMYIYNIINYRSNHEFSNLENYFKLYIRYIIQFFKDYTKYFYFFYNYYVNNLELYLLKKNKDKKINFLNKYIVFLNKYLLYFLNFFDNNVRRINIFFINALHLAKKFLIKNKYDIWKWELSKLFYLKNSKASFNFNLKFLKIFIISKVKYINKMDT